MAEKRSPEVIREEILSSYPPKVARKRKKSMMIREGAGQKIQANVRTIPGIISQRGCAYAGCKGVVLGPTRDIINLTHGPIGCGYYSWLTRRNQTRTASDLDDNFMTYCFSTDMQDENIVFGGEKKLRQAVQEAYDNFHPKSIGIFSTCPVGLIGDDVHAVARDMSELLGDCNVFGFSCEGYKGVSQSAGHHIANNQLFRHVVGIDDTEHEGKFKINLLGEYNIGGDAFELEALFEEMGISLISTFSGNSSYDQFANSHMADLNLVMCHRSINYLAEMMETKFGIPWAKINFIGAKETAKSLRKIAAYFDDPELTVRTEDIIAREMPRVKEELEKLKPRTKGKTAMLYVGGSRAHHYQSLFKELGMEVLGAGYEFAHRDDYEGRKALPDISVDADSRNIEELKINPDPERFKPRKTEIELKKLAESIDEWEDYEGMISDMPDGAWVVDDISHYEAEKLIEAYKPDIFCAGIKEKYAIQKSGIPLKQLHNYDYGGPYAGFRGAVNFYKDIERMVNSSVWDLIDLPWDTKPQLNAEYKAV